MKHLLKSICALCLALALTIPAFAIEPDASPLTDLDQVVHKDAVQLMVDLKVIQGKEDGSFDSKGTLDRATMAKLLYGILMNGADPALFASVDTGLTDIKDNWAENYIKYCYSVGIISGAGGAFSPSGPVNVASAAKMLLVTLGYDPLERGYASDPLWSDNIMRDAEEVGLLEGISQFSFEPLTRDNAAQMLYNALFAYTRTPKYGIRQNEQAIVGYTVNPTTLGLETLGLVRYTAKIGAVTGDAPPAVSYVSLFPQTNTVSDVGGILRQLRSGEAGISIPETLQNTQVVFYIKANYTLTDKKTFVENLSLEKIYSTQLTPVF